MGQTAKAPRENRTITIDFHDESTYFQLLSDGNAFVEFVLAFILSIGFQLKHKSTCIGGGCLTRHSHYARLRLGGLTIWRIQCTLCDAVAYLWAADNYDGPLAIRLKGCHQPVIHVPKTFSTPHSTLLAGI
jgi:hypothetical protein